MIVLQKHRRAAAKAVLESPLDRTDADRAKSARSAEKILAGRMDYHPAVTAALYNEG
jgi:hypothetical protein